MSDHMNMAELMAVVAAIPESAAAEAIEAAHLAQEVKESIPEDYSELSADVADLRSAISDIENLSPHKTLSGTYSGTRYTTVENLSIPAGAYRLTVDSVTSTDTDKTTCRVEFKNGSTDSLVLQLDRNVPIDMAITLESQVTKISFYASSIYAYTANDTFSFNNFTLSTKYDLLDKLDDIEDDISDLDGIADVHEAQIKNINDALKFYEETYLVKASTEHSSSDDMLDVEIPSGSNYRVQFSADITISSDSLNIKAYYSDDTSEYVKISCRVPSVNNLTASKKIVAFGFWSGSGFVANNANVNVKVYVDGTVFDVYDKIDWDETPVLNDFQIKTLKVFDSFTTLNNRSYAFDSTATIQNYNDYATTSTVAFNTPPIKIRNKDGKLIYKNLHITEKDASTYAAWTFDIDGKYLRSVAFSAMGSRATPFLSDEYYAILNEYPNTSGYTDTHWYVSNIDIEWLNGKNEYIVGPGGDFATFTAMLIALENDTREKTVYVKGGTYDIFTEMGGAEYIASIAPSVADLNWRDVCHVVPPNTTIIGLGNVVLSWQPTAEQMISESVAFLFSPLNTSGTCHIENISVVAKNCRYVVHDETSGLAQYNGAKHYYKNCRFTLLDGSYGFILYGAGHNKLMDIRFDDCVFDSQNASMIWSTHDWGTAVNDNSVFVFNNCVFISSIANPYVRFSSTDSVGRLDKVMFNNCYLEKIKFVTTSGNDARQGYDVQLIGCSPVEVEYDEHVTNRVAVRQYNPIPQST